MACVRFLRRRSPAGLRCLVCNLAVLLFFRSAFGTFCMCEARGYHHSRRALHVVETPDARLSKGLICRFLRLLSIIPCAVPFSANIQISLSAISVANAFALRYDKIHNCALCGGHLCTGLRRSCFIGCICRRSKGVTGGIDINPIDFIFLPHGFSDIFDVLFQQAFGSLLGVGKQCLVLGRRFFQLALCFRNSQNPRPPPRPSPSFYPQYRNFEKGTRSPPCISAPLPPEL